ncbi:MAG: MBL fold metallo-hydrolase [Bdellovibrionaceae bacterium]|nr:MBL fold metallo-hydrolase [Pseudobdellovibrionaceae bacterium]
MTVKLWGVRGSLPTPLKPTVIEERIVNTLKNFDKSNQDVNSFIKGLEHKNFGGYGGNTACVEVKSPNHRIIIDAGSGIRQLGAELLAGPCGKGQGTVDLLFTHFHWDHLVGLPFFIPIFIPGNIINVYSVQTNAEEVFRHVFQKPFFPVPYDRLGATIKYHKLDPREPHMFGELQVTPYQLDHPDPCWGYKIQNAGKTFSYCVDTECIRASRVDLGADLPLYQDVDLMVFDAQYTFSEAMEKIDWGHASAPVGLDVAMREGIKKVIFIHHDPAASDNKIADAEKQTRDYYEACIKEGKRNKLPINPVEWEFGYEGMEIKL